MIGANIILSNLHVDKIPMASATLAQCWKYAYKGLIHDDYLSSLKENHWIAFLEKSINDKTATCIIAEYESQIVGVSIFGKSITETYPNDGEVISLYVLPEFIGQNIGNMLFEKAQQSLKEQGHRHCIICTFTANTKAIRFYQSHDYEVVAQDETITMGTQLLPYVIMRKTF